MQMEADSVDTRRPSFKRGSKKRVAFFLGIYALVLIFGGLFAHQGMSGWAVVASVISGLLVLGGAYCFISGNRHALIVNFILIGGLSLFFVYRLFLIKKFYPPGLLLLMSLFLLLKLRDFKI